MPLKHNLIKNVWFHFLFVKNSNSSRYFFLKKAGSETLGEFRAANLVFPLLFELQLCTVCGRKDVCFEPRCTLVLLFCWSVLARQPSRAADPLLRSARGGDGEPPGLLAYRRWGPIYSRTYTAHGALGRLLWSCTVANVVGEPVDPFRWLKKPPALHFAAFHHPSWDYGIVFAYGLATR